MLASRPTAIALVREAVEDWRRANGWSRETTAQMIVEAHKRIGGQESTGIVFDPPTRDTFERMRVNADRVFRWFDDTTKDRNLLPLGFLASVLAALPMARRLALADKLLAPADIASREIEPADDDEIAAGDETRTVTMHFQAVLRHSSDAQVDMAQLLDGIDPREPERASRSLTRARAAMGAALRLLIRPGEV